MLFETYVFSAKVSVNLMSPQERKKYLKNEVEMLCYQIIASAGSGSELQKLLHELGDLDKDYD